MSDLIEVLANKAATAGSELERQAVATELRRVLAVELPPATGQAVRAGAMPAPQRLLQALSESAEKAKAFADHLHPEDLTSQVGKAFAAEIEAAMKRTPTLRQELETAGVIGKDGAVLGNPRALTRKEAQAVTQRSHTLLFKSSLFDTSDTVARNIVNSAIADVEDPGARKALQSAFDKVVGIADPEQLADRILRESKLAPGHGALFKKAVQERGCEQMSATLIDALRELRAAKLATKDELDLPRKIEALLEEELRPPHDPSIQGFRTKVSDLAPAIASAVTGRLDVDRVIEHILETLVRGDDAKKVLLQAFDAEGRRRLFENIGSFRKIYTSRRANAAGQNLYGWLYEASTFNKGVMRQETEKFVGRLESALEGTGVKITGARTSFDVRVPKTPGSSVELQATDHLSHVTLTRHSRSTGLVAVAGEHKGITGIAEGEQQLLAMPARYANKTIRADNQLYKIGTDLHLDVETALKGLGLTSDEIGAVVVKLKLQAGGVQYQRVIIYPPASAAGIGADEVKNGIRRVAHEIPRDRMTSLYASLALFFNLTPRIGP